jgi:hypothetical protein
VRGGITAESVMVMTKSVARKPRRQSGELAAPLWQVHGDGSPQGCPVRRAAHGQRGKEGHQYRNRWRWREHAGGEEGDAGQPRVEK